MILQAGKRVPEADNKGHAAGSLCLRGMSMSPCGEC